MKISDAEAAVEKNGENIEKIPAWQLTKVRNINEMIAEARNEGRQMHFASLRISVILRIQSWNHNFRNTKVESYSRGDTMKMIQDRI